VSQRLGVGVVPPIEAIVAAGGISTTIGLLFGLYPAERGARLNPIVALLHRSASFDTYRRDPRRS